MKKTKTLILLLTAIITCATAQADNITVGGTERTYYTYIPDDLGTGKPLLISMHGMNQDAGYQRGMLQIESVADTAKFAVVFPEGIDRSWDIGGQRDINFVLAIIDDMSDRYGIDKDRVYLSGFSMGGMFTYHAINHIADRIAAFAPISGYPMGGQEFTSSRPVPIIHTHGTSDDVVNFSGVQNILNGWIARNGCADQALVTTPYRGPHATLHQWGPGDDGVEVRLLELANKGHWIANDYFKTGEEIWNFCKRYSLADKHPNVTIKYPKASTQIMAIGTQSDLHVSIEANASSDYGDITSVDFYADNEYLGSTHEAPYTLDWNGFNKGDHLIKVVANDSEGNSCARAIPISANGVKKNLTLSAKFNQDGCIPDGWLAYNGRNLRVGPQTGLTGGARVIAMTGSPRDFNYALYVHHYTNKEDDGYGSYGDRRGTIQLMLTEGTYELGFKLANWDMPGGSDIRVQVLDAETGEIFTSTTVTNTLSLGGAATTPFSGCADESLSFVVHGTKMCQVKFLTANTKGADALISDVKIKKSSSEGIEDIDCAEKQPASVRYYDMYGRNATAATPGLIIRQTIFTDGSTASEKIIVR